MLYFNESLRGLSVGAPVTLLGLPAGEVTEVGLDIDPADRESCAGAWRSWPIPSASSRRLGAQQAAIGEQPQGRASRSATPFFKRLVEERGLRAQLRSGSLLTGQLFVAFDYFPDAPKAKVDWSQDPPELPVVPSTIPDSRPSSAASSPSSTSCRSRRSAPT